MNDSKALSKVLQHCVAKADALKCPVVDWSDIGGIDALLSRNYDVVGYSGAYLKAYDNYYQTIWETVFFNLLGEQLLHLAQSQNQSISILDIGCSTSKHFRNMFDCVSNANAQTLSYVSIDKDPKLNGSLSSHLISVGTFNTVT